MSTLAKGMIAIALIVALSVAYNAYKKHEANALCDSIQDNEPVPSMIQRAHDRGFEYNKNLYDPEAKNSYLLFYGGWWYRCTVDTRDGKVRDRNVRVRD